VNAAVEHIASAMCRGIADFNQAFMADCKIARNIRAGNGPSGKLPAGIT
jgi:hypothetical protein